MLFVHSLNGRGIAAVATCVAEVWASEGHEVALTAGSVTPEVDRPKDVKIIDLKGSERVTFTAIPVLRRAIRRFEPEVLFGHGNGPARASILASRGLERRPTVVAVEHNHYSSYPWRLRAEHDLANRLILHRADRVVGVAPEIVEDLERLFPRVRGKTSTVPPPFTRANQMAVLAKEAIAHPWFQQGEPPVVVTVANIHLRKDPETLVRAMVQVNARSATPVRLALIGEPQDEALAARLVRLADEGGIGDRVALLGFQPNPLAYVARSTVFALTSRNEGLPIALLESMALGIPIVSTDCPSGPRYLLAGGRYGELVPVGDAAAVAGSILHLIEDRDHADKLSREGLERVQRFSPEQIAHDYLALVEPTA